MYCDLDAFVFMGDYDVTVICAHEHVLMYLWLRLKSSPSRHVCGMYIFLPHFTPSPARVRRGVSPCILIFTVTSVRISRACVTGRGAGAGGAAGVEENPAPCCVSRVD